jgi:Ca2+/Na+ antiporter
VVDTLTGGSIINPASQISDASRQVFSRGLVPALYLGVRMVYSNATITANPVVKVFGRARMPNGEAGPWRLLKSRLKDSRVTLLTDPSDLTKDGLRVPTADLEAHFFDVQGCNEFLIGVEVVAAGTLLEDAILEVVFI